VWLLPVLSGVLRAAARSFYQLQVAGPEVSAEGPVLLFANHPNSLLDPALVATAAGRSVRFLAKSPLFTDPRVGWLVRASGAIPVHRRSEDPQAAARNVQMFEAVYRELDALEPVELETLSYRPRRPLYFWPLGLAVLLAFGYHLLMGLRSGVQALRARHA